MSFGFAAEGTCTNLKNVQSENFLSIPTINYSPRTPGESALEFNNYAMNINELLCSQYRQPGYMSPISTYVGCNNGSAHVVTSEKLNLTSGLMDADTKSNDSTVIPSNLVTQPYTPFGRLCNNDFTMSMSCFPQHIFHPEEPKPQYSYIGLIALAILSSAETKLVLSDIYQYILDNYPYFRARGPGWRNSIRHNLSLNDCFLKSGRSANGKGHYWAIHPANIDDFRKGDFRRRKAQRKVRKHMGLPLDTVDPDSPSPPPPQVDITSPPPTMVPANPLHIAPTSDCAAGSSYEHPPAQMPYAKHRQQFHDTYFGAAIMEHYRSVPANFHNTNRHTTSILSHKQCTGHQNNKLFNSLTHNNALFFLTQQNSVSNNETSKQTGCSRTTAKNSSNYFGQMASASTQIRKRQFDVASLLAPESSDFDSKHSSEEAQTAEVGISSVEQATNCGSARPDDHPVEYCKQLLHRHLFVSSALQQQIRLPQDDQEDEEIVDVVASDIVDVVSNSFEDKKGQDPPLILVDKENDFYIDQIHVKKGSQTYNGKNKGCEDAHIYNSWYLPTKLNTLQEQYTDIPKIVSNATSSLADFQTYYSSKLISSSSTHVSKAVKSASIVDCASSENRNNGIHQMQLYSNLHTGSPITSHSIAHRHKHVKRLIHQFHKHNINLAKLDADSNVQSFGHYYGSYMAAAAAHIDTMQLAELQQQNFL